MRALLLALLLRPVHNADGVLGDRVEHCDNMGNESPFICKFVHIHIHFLYF